jgi:phosphate transport system substrate-binding protein
MMKWNYSIGVLLLFVLFLGIFLPLQVSANLIPEDSNKKATDELLSAASSANVAEIIILLLRGADVNAVDWDGNTPLVLAAANNTPQVIRFLIGKGANVNAANHWGFTPLMYAAIRSSNPEVLRILLEYGADINAAYNDGATPLMFAAEYNSFEIIQTLLNNGADIALKDTEGKIALDYAERNENFTQYSYYQSIGFDREVRVADDVDLNLYHPWSESAQFPYLDSPASFCVSGEYPRVDGATSAYPIYAAAVNEVFTVNDKTELQQYLFCSRTEGAYNRLIRGEVDMIFVLQPSDEQLQSAKDAGVELHFTPIAKDAFVFFVNSRNPISELSLEQIRDIYLDKITNWQEVGGLDNRILPYRRQINSGSQTAMIKEVMKGEELPPLREELISRGMAIMVLDVAEQYQNRVESIGYSFRYFTEDMMRSVFEKRKKQADYYQLAIDLIPADDPDMRERREKYQNEIQNVLKPVKLLAVNGIAPSEENIRNDTYPFTVNVYAVTAGTSNPHVRELIDWLLSPQGQELIEKTGYVGVK